MLQYITGQLRSVQALLLALSALRSIILMALQVEDFFTHLLQRVVPKHDTQARAEVTVTRRFLENFSGDQVLFLHKCISPAAAPRPAINSLSCTQLQCRAYPLPHKLLVRVHNSMVGRPWAP